MNRDRSMSVRTAATLAMALAIGGCGDTTGPEALDAAIEYDMAILAGDATLEDMALWSTPIGFGVLGAPPMGDLHGGRSGDLTVTHEVTFYDADGNEQAAYDALTTASLHALHEVDGQVSRDGWTVTVHRERDKTVTGLLGTETHRTWNGTGSEQVTRTGVTLAGQERTYEADGEFTYDDVVVPIPGSVPRYPVSGTVTRSLTVTITGPSGSETKSVEVVITFDGDSTATAVVNGVTREIDLTARSGDFPLRRRRG
jgi:hypothetical protein